MDAVDHVVVGGGVYGCGVAWELARGGREVLLLEAETIASGASGGLGQRGIRANARDSRELALARRAHERWPSFADEIQAPTGFERTGHLQLVEREEDLPTARHQVDEQCRNGIATELVDGERLRTLEPQLAPSVVAATYCAADGVSDHTATTVGLALAAERAGAVVREHAPVTALHRDGRRVVAVDLADGDQITVGRSVVLLANASLPRLLEPLGVTLPLFDVWPQALVTEPVDPVPVHHLIGHAHRQLALKPLPDRRVMITGGRLGRRDPATGGGVVDDDQVAGNLADAVAVYPSLAGVELVAAVADRSEAIAHDLVPIIDTVPGTTNAHFATGWSGHGWAIAPAVIELVATWAATADAPEVLRPFGLHRF